MITIVSHRARGGAAVFAAIAALVAACSSDDTTTTAEPTTTSAADELAGSIDLVVADADRCDPIAEGCLYPFPNDYYTVEDPDTPTGRRVALAADSLPANATGVHIDPTEWNRSDGFSPGAAPIVMIPGVDLEASGVTPITDIGSSLDDGGQVVLWDSAASERIPHWVETDSFAEDPAQATLMIHPAVSLPEGHRIVVGLAGLVDGSGAPIEPTDAFRAYRDRLGTDVTEIEARREAMETVFDDLDAAGMDRDSLIMAWDFTVASAENNSARLLSIRDAAFDELGDAAPAFTVTSNTPSDREGIDREISGTYLVPLFLTGSGEAGSSFALGENGLPTRTGETMFTANFTCIVPDSATAAAPGRSGVYGHGLLGLADQVPGGAGPVAAASNTVFCGTDLIGMSEGDYGNAAKILTDLSTFNTLADRLQQGHLNTLFLGRLMIRPDGLGSDAAFQDAGTPVLTDELYYYGISQGGIMGAATTAVAQDWTRAVLGVPAANYSLLLDRSIDFDEFRLVYEPSYPAAADRVIGLQLIQMLWDRGEANGYLQHLTSDPYPDTPAHVVLLHEAFGDHQVANVATEIEARTIGAAGHRPALTDGRIPDKEVFWGIDELTYPHEGSAVVMWDSGAAAPPLTNTPPREGEDPHGDPRGEPAAIRQITEFLQPQGKVIDVCDGAVCTAESR